MSRSAGKTPGFFESRLPLGRGHRGNVNPSGTMRTSLAALLLLTLLGTTSCRVAESPPSISAEQIAILFRESSSGVNGSEVQHLLSDTRGAPHTDPNWPALSYLTGEAELRSGDIERARATFRELATWSAYPASTGPLRDGWGGSGLAAVALWRWLQILDAYGGSAEEITQVLSVARAVYRTRLFVGMVHPDLLPALPLIEEDGARLLAHVLWKAKRPEADSVFLAFVGIDSVGQYDDVDDQIAEQMFEQGKATRERLDLFRYRRQLGLIMTDSRKQRSADALWQLWSNTSAPADVRAEAGFEWANYYRRSKDKKKDVLAVLLGAYDLAGTGLIAEKALFAHGMVQNSVSPRNPDAFFSDMARLIGLYPHSPLVADALYQIAAEQLFATPPAIDEALSNFAKLRAIEGVNGWVDSAYFLAAITLIERARGDDLSAADALLASYVENFPDGVFRLRCLFWRGRIAERQNQTTAAVAIYRSITEQAPYDYYGLRAAMHVEDGASAIPMALPRENSKTWTTIRNAYRDGVPEPELRGMTPYHLRLLSAERTGLYQRLIAAVDDMGKQFRNRLDNIPLQDLDGKNLIPAAAMLLALRQDALAARDSVPTAENRLRLAAFLTKVGDSTSALAMTQLRGDAPHQRIADLQKDPRFLATAYPRLEAPFTLAKALLGAARPIDGSAALSENLMYAIARNESGFYAGAISPVGAIGLFQIMPSNFDGTQDCWRLPPNGDVTKKPTAASYLFDPGRNAQFWSCWIDKEKIQPATRTDIPLMLVKQNAGTGNLNEWMRTWHGRPIEHDLELQIDSFRFPATQVFVRSVLTDLAIADAGGIFDENSGAVLKEKP
jgi:soluble lytic murein transglycosylase-like protein